MGRRYGKGPEAEGIKALQALLGDSRSVFWYIEIDSYSSMLTIGFEVYASYPGGNSPGSGIGGCGVLELDIEGSGVRPALGES